MELEVFHGFINVFVHVSLHGLDNCWWSLQFCASLSPKLCITASVSLDRHNINALTCFTVSSSTSPERKQYESHCARHAAKYVPLSTFRSSLGRLLWRKVYIGSAIGLSKYKNGGKWMCDIPTLIPYLVPLTGTREPHLCLERSLTMFYTNWRQVTLVFAVPCIDLQPLDSWFNW